MSIKHWGLVKHGRDSRGAVGDMIGIFEDDGRPIINRLDMSIGHSDWWIDDISKAQFETYKEFGFRVLDLEPYDL